MGDLAFLRVRLHAAILNLLTDPDGSDTNGINS